jgi:hypothetical protein
MPDPDEVVQGVGADPINVFYVEWAKESLKATIPFMNDMLYKFTLLNVALLGGGLAFVGEETIGTGAKSVMILCFLVSLIFSLYGLRPYTGEVNLYRADIVMRHKHEVAESKRRVLDVAGFFLAAGFVVALIGLVRR